MRELTAEEIDMVGGAGWLRDLWNWLVNHFNNPTGGEPSLPIPPGPIPPEITEANEDGVYFWVDGGLWHISEGGIGYQWSFN